MYSFGLFPAGRDLSWITDNEASPTPVQVAFSSTPTFDLANGLIQRITLTADVSSSTFVLDGGSFIPDGTQFWLHVMQDGTGGYFFAFPTNVRNPSAQNVGLGANVMTTCFLEYRNNGWDFNTPLVEGPVT